MSLVNHHFEENKYTKNTYGLQTCWEECINIVLGIGFTIASFRGFKIGGPRL
jgi:hypothetical protein